MQQKSALFIWGGWDGHQPKECAELFAGILSDSGFKVTIRDSLDALQDADALKELSVIVPIWTMGKIGNTEVNNLLEAVKSGVGIAGWHGGMGDAFRESCDYQFMVGGQFVGHPGNVIDYRVRITRPDDSIVRGIPDFDVHSEQYYMHVDPSNEVLAETTFTGEHCEWIEGTVMPVVWKRRWGSGRVFYSALGHQVQEFDVPESREITKRGILWAARVLDP